MDLERSHFYFTVSPLGGCGGLKENSILTVSTLEGCDGS